MKKTEATESTTVDFEPMDAIQMSTMADSSNRMIDNIRGHFKHDDE